MKKISKKLPDPGRMGEQPGARPSSGEAATRRAKRATSPMSLDLWIMAGQSNMEGCGALAESLAPDPRVFCFTSHWKWAPAKDPLHDLLHSTESVDWALRLTMMPPEIPRDEKSVRAYWKERCYGIGAGLGIAFGKTLANATRRKVGLVACAHGGTSMEQWSEEKKSQGRMSLYGAMLERVKASGGTPRGLLWYQGESDTSPENVERYEARFIKWVAAVRKDLGAPNLPVISVQLGNVIDSNRPSAPWERMREVQLGLEKKIPHHAVTTAVDLSLNDMIHIDAPGLIRLGGRMARLALSLCGDKKILRGPRLEKIVSSKNRRGFGEIRLKFSGVTGKLLPRLHRRAARCPADQPEQAIHGFILVNAEGAPHPKRAIFQARRGAKANEILLRTTAPCESGDKIFYGKGLSPICNVVDEADMALPAFCAEIPTT
ncbi:MAG: sialate O-acetylesterase [Spirochaetia bacterium]|nr:sialate O-acetylesterase [Spirochaetia bacterium]